MIVLGRSIYESHRETRENLTGKLQTGVVVRAPYDDILVVEEEVTVIDKKQPTGFVFDAPGHGFDIPGIGLDSEPNVIDTYVIPNASGEFIERFRTDWFKPDTMPTGIVWDTTNHELRW